jgi:hypothetical protein
MTAVTPLVWYADDPKIGLGLNYTYTTYTSVAQATNVEFPGPPQVVGDTCYGINNSKWIFVQASTTITAGNVIWISEQFKANNLLTNPSLATSFGATAVLSDIHIGFAQFNNGGSLNIASSLLQALAQPNDYFWALLEAAAGIQLNVATTSCQRGPVAVYHSGAKPGNIVTSADLSTTASATYLVNLYINTSLDSTTSSTNQTITDCFTIGRVRTSVSTTS